MKQVLPNVSLIVPCYNEEDYIDSFLNQINAFNYPSEKIETIIVDGGSSDCSMEIVKKRTKSIRNLIILSNPKKFVPISMNMGIKAAHGDYVVRLDVHAFYPEDYLAKLIMVSIETGAQNVGGLCKTGTMFFTQTSSAIQKVFEDPFGVGNSKFRIGIKSRQEVDTVPFGCFPRLIFNQVGLYDERLIRGQDYELNQRIKRFGGKIILDPTIVCTYFPRTTFYGLWKNRFATGKGVIKMSYFLKSFYAVKLRHFIPLFFVLSIFLPMVFVIFIPQTLLISLFSISLYVLVFGLRSLKLADVKSSMVHIFIAFIVLHTSYGCGSLSALFSIGFKRK